MLRKKRYFLVVMTLIILIGIGYATLSANLSITGLNVFKGNTWDVHFQNVIDKSINTANSFTTGTISQDGKSINFDVTLTNPGESYVFFTDVVNEGSLDAMLDNYTLEGIPEELENTIELNVSYLDGEELNQYDLLRKNTRETIKVEVLFKDSDELEISDLPTSDYDFSLTLSINYLQSDNNALARVAGSGDQVLPVIKNLKVTPMDHNLIVEIDSYDAYSAITKYYYSKDGGETFVESTNPNYTFTSLEDDDYEIVVYTKDISGNLSEESTTVATITSIYAMYYSDGTLVLNHSGEIDETKTLVDNYGDIAYQTFTYSSHPWNSRKSSITTVDITEEIKPYNTVYLFGGLSNLTQILHISNLNTANVTDMQSMFRFCGAPSLDLTSFNTSKVTNMSGMFYNSKTTTLNISNWNTSNVTDMSEMFRSAKVTSLDLNNWNTSKVTTLSEMFNSASSLSTLNVSNWNTSNVTTMYYLFKDTSNLTSLDVSNWNTSKVTNMSYTFANITRLTSLNVSNWDTSKVTNMSYMFRATKVSTLDIENWDTSKVTTMYGMFQYATNIQSLDLSKWNTSSLTDLHAIFQGMSSLEDLNISTWDVSNVEGGNAWATFHDCSKLNGLDLSKWDTRKITYFNSTFSRASQNATNKVWYYGPNSINMYENASSAGANYITFEYKER